MPLGGIFFWAIETAVSREICVFALSVVDFSLCDCLTSVQNGKRGERGKKRAFSFHSEGATTKHLPLTLSIAWLVFLPIKLLCGCC